MSKTTDIKAGFSGKYILLTTLVALIPTAIGGVIGYGFNEYTKDRKVLEVSSASSGNLASMPVSVAGNLEILLPVSSTRKETVKGLYRYDVGITNRTEQGADDVALFLEPPKGIELVSTPEITTTPPSLAKAISVKQTTGPSGNAQVVVSLLNPSQTVKLGYLGFSRDGLANGNAPLSVVVLKKDWAQRNVSDNAPAAKNTDVEQYFLIFAAVVLAMLTVMTFMMSWITARRRASVD